MLPVLEKALDTLDAFVWLGDNIYLTDGQWSSDSAATAKYHEVFDAPEYQRILSKSRHFAIWDDHDAGPNDCDTSFHGFGETMKAFKEFWKPSYSMVNFNSYYGSTLLANDRVELFFLDNRSFRTPKGISNATALGSEQLEWFKDAYRSSKASLKVVLLGGQLLNTAAVFENMALFPEERLEIIELLSANEGIPVVLTGDRHSGELNALKSKGKTVLEACASPITASAHPHHDELNENRLHSGTTDTQHFGTLQLIEKGKAYTVVLKLIGPNGMVLFSHRETYNISDTKN
jgi:alkaline phosphatase D